MKTTILGSAAVITSAVKLEDIKTLAKYDPKALTMWEKDEDDVKIPVFSVVVKDGAEGAICDNGAIFGKESTEGFAQITMLTKVPKSSNPKDFVAEELGGALLKLAAWEETVPAVIADINARKEAVLASIETA